MIASYMLSRTLVPTLAITCCASTHAATTQDGTERAAADAQSAGALPARLRAPVRARPRRLSRPAALAPAAPRRRSIAGFLAFVVLSFGARARSSARTSSRPSMAARSSCTCGRRPARGSRRPHALADHVEEAIRQIIPAGRARRHRRQHRPAASAASTCPTTTPATIGAQDGDILVSAEPGPPRRRTTTSRRCASSCRAQFPGIDFFFLPADIVTQILNFGVPAPIDVQFAGNDVRGQPALANDLLAPHQADPRHRRRAHPAGVRAARP